MKELFVVILHYKVPLDVVERFFRHTLNILSATMLTEYTLSPGGESLGWVAS